jgi:anti-anti-sigma regulatory factor
MTTRAVDRSIVLQPAGDLCEGAACDELERELLSLAGDGRHVIVDLSATRILTAHCLGVLARAQRLAAAAGGNIALCGAAGLQRWLLGVTHLTEALPIYASQAEALASFGPHSAVA